jgi:hypothetical protein
MICLLVLVDSRLEQAPLASFAGTLAASAPLRLVVLPVPAVLTPLAEPLVLSEAQQARFADPSASIPYPLTFAEWPAHLEFGAALPRLLEEHRASGLLVQRPADVTPVSAARLVHTPFVHLLSQPPCLLLVTPAHPVAVAVPRRVLYAVGAEPADLSWGAQIVNLLWQAWRPNLRIAVAASGGLLHWQRVGQEAARRYWSGVLPDGLPVQYEHLALPNQKSVADQLAALALAGADLLALVLPGRNHPRQPLTRRAVLFTLLQSPVPVLLLPATIR